MPRSFDEVIEYVESQYAEKCKVLSAKIENEFDDLGVKVNVWNVKTDENENWWVVEGDEIPMNLYTQDAHYFSTDEVYSFHMGLMNRMFVKQDEYMPENFVKAISLDGEIAPVLFRKLKNVATAIESATEIEDFQAIGVQCREILIELGNSIYQKEMAGDEEQPQESNFKKKAELFISFYLSGSENKDYRNYIKKITEATWDYTCKITHTQNSTYYEVSTCITLVTSLVSLYENIRQKVFDPLSQYMCNNCKSKKLMIINDEHDENGIVSKFYLKCDECSEITEIIFEKNETGTAKYIKGKNV